MTRKKPSAPSGEDQLVAAVMPLIDEHIARHGKKPGPKPLVREPFMVRLTPEERKALADASRTVGMTESGYLRYLLRKAVGLAHEP